MRPMFIPTRQAQLHALLIFALSLTGILSVQDSLAQTGGYTVVELTVPGEIPTRLNNLGELLEEEEVLARPKPCSGPR